MGKVSWLIGLSKKTVIVNKRNMPDLICHIYMVKFNGLRKFAHEM